VTQLGGLGTHAQYDDEGNPLDPDAITAFGKVIRHHIHTASLLIDHSQTTYALEILTWPAVGMTKISVLLLYRRIFATPKFKAMAWILVGVIIAWTIAFTFALMCMFFSLP